jgi:prephenate dehydrogenase
MTDLGLAKRGIVARAAALGLAHRFAGSRPAAEPAAGGLAGARADVIDGVPVYVAPVPGGEDAAREIAHFWEAVCGAHAVVLDAERHDALAALGVQLPELMAAVLASVLAQRLPAGTAPGPTARALTAPAVDADPGRIEALWENRAQAAAALRAAAEAALRIADGLGAGDRRTVEAALAAAARWRRGHGGGA